MNAASNSQVSSAPWMNGRNSLLAILCLILGAGLGLFVARRSRVAPPAKIVTAAVQPPAESAAGVRPVTAEQLKHMGDKQAQPLLEQLKATPDDPVLLAKLGHIYYVTYNFKDAATYYKQSVEKKDDAVIRTELGRAYFYSGDSDSAIAEFQRVLKADSGNANALFNLGMVKWHSKSDADGALAAWRQLLQKNPNHPRRAEIEKLIAQVEQQRSTGPSVKAHNPI